MTAHEKRMARSRKEAVAAMLRPDGHITMGGVALMPYFKSPHDHDFVDHLVEKAARR